MEGEKKKQIIEPIFSPNQGNVQQAAPQVQVQAQTPRSVATQAEPANGSQSTVTSRVANLPNDKPTVNKVSRSLGVGGLGVSISAFSQEKKEEEIRIETRSEVLTERFTPIQLIKEWKAYAEVLIEEHHLKNTMLNCLPNLQDNNIFEIIVNNPMQEQRLLEYKMDILNKLKEQLRNTQIQMQVRISEDNEKKLAFTPAEKFNLMMEENESLRRLKDEFGLELS
jgi:DNA polymerase-3 subunit gamma/tau